MKVKNLETPALVIDRQEMEENLQRMNGLLEGTGLKLRPHYKTHKSPVIARLQLEHGACGITCSKLSEAEDLANAGIEDILIANQVVQPSKISRLAHLAGRCCLTVCVDQEENIRALSAAAVLAGTQIHCYVELDIGMNRCGVTTFEEFYRLAALLEELPGVSYDGVQAYAGNLAHEYEKEKREAATAANEKRLKELLAYLSERGIESREVSGGSTGTVALKTKSAVYTEIQSGSFIFLDMAYQGMNTVFRNALYVMATVVSAGPDHFVIDAGIKSICPDQGNPGLVGHAYESINLSEEHTAFYGTHSFQVGDMVQVIPGHCCSTVNLYDEMYLVTRAEGSNDIREAVIADRLQIVSRGKAQ
ncbi:MAG: alanine racemase [Firmicutes bacterium]|nr:alanine racemase [Bacillota bacterium]